MIAAALSRVCSRTIHQDLIYRLLPHTPIRDHKRRNGSRKGLSSCMSGSVLHLQNQLSSPEGLRKRYFCSDIFTCKLIPHIRSVLLRLEFKTVQTFLNMESLAVDHERTSLFIAENGHLFGPERPSPPYTASLIYVHIVNLLRNISSQSALCLYLSMQSVLGWGYTRDNLSNRYSSHLVPHVKVLTPPLLYTVYKPHTVTGVDYGKFGSYDGVGTWCRATTVPISTTISWCGPTLSTTESQGSIYCQHFRVDCAPTQGVKALVSRPGVPLWSHLATNSLPNDLKVTPGYGHCDTFVPECPHPSASITITARGAHPSASITITARGAPTLQPPSLLLHEVPTLQPPSLLLHEVPTLQPITARGAPTLQPPSLLLHEVPTLQPPSLLLHEVPTFQPITARGAPTLQPPNLFTKRIYIVHGLITSNLFPGLIRLILDASSQSMVGRRARTALVAGHGVYPPRLRSSLGKLVTRCRQVHYSRAEQSGDYELTSP
ncbi:hypothetical protein RRG08_032728 [Elysia crispata]|uniref:Uncharacterized protein n=1 Tax=Elysia crispata TaxID=231223 RepID=A0AAE0YUZ6_9GAST|nr:hypothetical protein RRG08_032728 [Elysia crispata]